MGDTLWRGRYVEGRFVEAPVMLLCVSIISGTGQEYRVSIINPHKKSFSLTKPKIKLSM